jgi:hypothetical protein
MADVAIATIAMVFLIGLFYFWYKCKMFAVSLTLLLLGTFITPVGAEIGIYWAIKDFYIFRSISKEVE